MYLKWTTTPSILNNGGRMSDIIVLWAIHNYSLELHYVLDVAKLSARFEMLSVDICDCLYIISSVTMFL